MYSAVETLEKDERGFWVVRAIRDTDRRPVLLKVPGSRSNQRCREQLRNDFTIRGPLHDQGVLQALAFDTYEGKPALVMEDFRGESLDRTLGQPMGIEPFLQLAIRVAAAVDEIHRHGLVHKDLKPQSILVEAATGTVKITDFSVACAVSGPRTNSSLIEGTLPYMAPEQTGRMNRAVDQRSDLYSLGVTFFEMLTGKLPFVASDALQWIHCHIACSPRALTEIRPDVPSAVAAIVMKLLAKAAEERYQTALGLKHDLHRCLAQWCASGSIEPFPLGVRDISDRLQVPQKLYGRDVEIAMLSNAFDRVAATGRPEVVLVKGYAGTGKSSIAQELRQPIAKGGGFFTSGKFEEQRREVPYGVGAQAFSELLLEIFARGDEQIALFRARLQEALGAQAQAIVDVIPQLELFIGPQPPVPALPPAESKERLYAAFRRFLHVFARPEHPVLLFHDDLQWADAASLDLVRDFVTHADTAFFLYVGAYRDDELSPSHPLTRLIDGAHEAGVTVTEIPIGPLSTRDMVTLTGDMLRCPPEVGESLALLVHEKTGGNPFFALQFLLGLSAEGLLSFDPRAERWRWDIARLRARDVTDNVADWLVGKLRRLPTSSLAIVKLAACVGSAVDVVTLALLQEGSQAEAERELAEAAREGLVFRAGDTWRFVHDRVRESAYALIPEAEQAAMHLRIGRRLLATTHPDAMGERVFDVVRQFDRAATRIVDREERGRVATLNLAAGRRAKANAAYRSAASYFAAGVQFLETDAWSTQRELAWAFHLERAECEYLSGDFEESERLLDVLFDHASGVEVAQASLVRINLLGTRGDFRRAVHVGLECLERFGIRWTPHPDASEVRAECAKVWEALGERTIEQALDLPLMSDPDLRAVMDLLWSLEGPFFCTDTKLWLLAGCRMAALSLLHGNSGASTVAYTVFGCALGPLFGRYEEGWRFGKVACDLVDKQGFLAHKATTFLNFGCLIVPLSQPLTASIPFLETAMNEGATNGDILQACYSAMQVLDMRLALGIPLEELAHEASLREGFVRKARHAQATAMMGDMARLIRSLRGQTVRFGSFDEAGFDERAVEESFAATQWPFRASRYFIQKVQARYLAGAYDEALVAASRAMGLLWVMFGQIELAEYALYDALARAAVYEKASAEARREHLEAIRAHEAELHAWASRVRENFEAKHKLVAAELDRIEGRELEALRGYQEATNQARVGGFGQVEALGLELAANLWGALGFDRVARLYLEEAREAYLRWGADGKVAQIDRDHPQVFERKPLALESTRALRAEEVDLLSVVKASQTISREIRLDNVTATLLKVAIEQSAARRGCLLLGARDEPLGAVAEAAVGEGGVEVTVYPSTRPSVADVPMSIAQYVRRVRAWVLLDDAAMSNRFGSDSYFVHARPRSVLCLPVVKQGEVIGVLYLENDLVPGAFTPDRITVLELLSTQSAISLENAMLLDRERRAREAAEAAYHAAQEAVRQRDEFFAMAAHELFTPITALNLLLQAMLRRSRPEGADAATLRPRLQRAREQGQRLTRLMRASARSSPIRAGDLLDVARIESGQFDFQLVQIDLSQLVREVASRFEGDLARARCTAVIRGEAPVVGRWDRSRIGQVVTNLLSNAIKFGAGGPIELAVERVGTMARLSVRDAGIGIDPEQQPRIFDRFERAVSARHYGGLGLGLYISRRIVEASGGAIRVESRPGKGSTFTVELPSAMDGPPPRAEAQP